MIHFLWTMTNKTRGRAMDMVEALADLEINPDLHCARLLLLLNAFAGEDGTGEVEGLTKLAKLDFLLRYPVLLQRALAARGKSTRQVKVLDHERNSVESKMVRFRYGPWDHRYYRLLNVLVAQGLARLTRDGRRVHIGLTGEGIQAARALLETDEFEDIARRARLLKTGVDIQATHLVRFIYETFPEVVSLKLNERIEM